MKRWVITGAASGFGREVAVRALRRGDAVVGVDLDAAGLRVLSAEGPHLQVRPVDVRDPGGVASLAAEVLAHGGVDVLVNAAGYGFFASQATASLDAVAALFDTNVLGAARVTQALLPGLLVAQGCVVQLSSLAGRVALPESGYYAATKHALEALSEALYVEHAGAGLRVRVIEPGAFATGFSERAARSSTPRAQEGAERARHAAWDGLRQAVLEPPQDPARVADAILREVDVQGPGFRRVPVGGDAQRLMAARDLLGGDGWTLLLAACLEGAPPPPGVVASPTEVLAAGERGPASRAVRAAVAAWRAGLLPGWTDPALLAVLRARALSAEGSGGPQSG